MKRMALKATIETIEVRLHSPKLGTIVRTNVPVIMPDSMAEAIWQVGEQTFRHYFLGSVNARKFWRHCNENCEWFRQHPGAHHSKKSHLLPFSLYGDEVQSFRNTEAGAIEILGWSSDFGHGHAPLSRYLPILALSEHLICDDTWPDIWRAIIPRLHRLLTSGQFAWSAAGYKFMLSSIQGDLKWLLSKFGVFNFLKNEFCTRCACCKAHPNDSMTLGDMRVNASHASTTVTHAQFLASGSDASRALHCIAANIMSFVSYTYIHTYIHTYILTTYIDAYIHIHIHFRSKPRGPRLTSNRVLSCLRLQATRFGDFQEPLWSGACTTCAMVSCLVQDGFSTAAGQTSANPAPLFNCSRCLFHAREHVTALRQGVLSIAI